MLSPEYLVDVTQQQIDEIRLGPEREMLNDLKRRYAAGDDLQTLDSQGAAPVRSFLIVYYPKSLSMNFV